MPVMDADNVAQSMVKLEQLLQRVEHEADVRSRETVHQVVQALMDFHGAALGRIIDHLRNAGEAGQDVLEQIATDELACHLLHLYGLHPHSLTQRIAKALESVRPYLHSHGGNVELLGVETDGRVRLRLDGSCHGCPSSAATLRDSIEQAIYAAAPDVNAIEVEGVNHPAPPLAPQGFVPVSAVQVTDARLPQEQRT